MEMEAMLKGMRPSKLDACIENITRTLVQRSQEDNAHHSSNQTSFYRTESFQPSNDGSSSLKMKIRKVGTYQTPDELKPYECPICHKKISNQANLRTHIRTHTGDKPHRCGICGKSFSRNGTLQTHLTIHSGVKLYKCEICGREIRDRGNLSKHMKIHLSNIVPKQEMGPLNMSNAPLYIKREKETLNNSQRESLKAAEFSTPTSSQMEMLRKEIYALSNSQVDNLRKEMGSTHNSQLDQQYQKPHSLNNTSSKKEDNEPADMRANSISDETLKVNTFSKLNLKKKDMPAFQKTSQSQGSKISYNCGLCLIAFPDTDSYFAHMMAHARDQRFSERGPEDYIDEQVASWMKNKKSIKMGMDENPMDPEDQEMLAAYERELMAYHEQKTKLNEQFQRSFSEQKMSSADTKMAADEQKVASADIDKMESDDDDDDDDDGDDDEGKVKEKCSYKCGICGNQYNTKDEFEDHITIHKVDKPYQCTICLEQFKELRYLQKHCRSHRGWNPFWCEKCGKEFSQSIFLIEHLQTHTDEQQASGSTINGNFNTSLTKIPQPTPKPQGDKQDMFIVIE